jgi:hypothetical protein
LSSRWELWRTSARRRSPNRRHDNPRHAAWSESRRSHQPTFSPCRCSTRKTVSASPGCHRPCASTRAWEKLPSARTWSSRWTEVVAGGPRGACQRTLGRSSGRRRRPSRARLPATCKARSPSSPTTVAGRGPRSRRPVWRRPYRLTGQACGWSPSPARRARYPGVCARLGIGGIGAEVHFGRESQPPALPDLKVALDRLAKTTADEGSAFVLTLDEVQVAARDELGLLGAALQAVTADQWPMVVAHLPGCPACARPLRR